MSMDPEVVRIRLQTLQLIAGAEVVLHDAERNFKELRALLAELRQKAAAEEGKHDRE